MAMTLDQQRALARARARQRTGSSSLASAQGATKNVVPGALNAGVRGAVDTASLGFDDEIAAGLTTGFGYGGDYSAKREAYDQSKTASREKHPYAFTAGQVAGALPAALIPGGAASLAGRVGVGMATGTGLGGLYGAGSSQPGERLRGTAEGAAVGGLVGGALPVVASGVSRAYQAGSRALTSNRAARNVGSTPEALRMIGNVMDADGTRGPQGAANMARAGQEAMLADAGPNARTILDTAIQRGGPGALRARRAITGRVQRDSARLTNALDDILGPPEGITATRTAIRQGSAAARDRTYRAAYSSPIDYSQPTARRMEEMIRTRVPPEAINAANRLMRTRGEASQQINAIIGNDGSVIFETLPDVRQIDYITRGLNLLAESGDGAGALGGQTALGSSYQALSRDIRQTLRRLVPNYGAALDTAADPIERSQAVQFGGRLLSRSVARDQVAETVAGMSRAERQATAQGIRSNIDDMMANTVRAIQDGDMPVREAIKGLKELSSRANREKVGLVIGQDRAGRLFRELDRITTSFELRASVAENSKTYARLATDRRVKDVTAPGPLGLFAQGKAIQAPQRVLQSATAQTPADLVAREDAIYSELADVLTRPAGQARQTFDAIDRLMASEAAGSARADSIRRMIEALSYPTIVQTREMLPSQLRITGDKR